MLPMCAQTLVVTVSAAWDATRLVWRAAWAQSAMMTIFEHRCDVSNLATFLLRRVTHAARAPVAAAAASSRAAQLLPLQPHPARLKAMRLLP